MACANLVTRSLRCSGALAAMCCGLLMPALAPAEEGGSGHYQPGSMSSFADGVPAEPTVVARLNLVHYNGDYQRGQPLPIAGLTTIDASATATAVALSLAWAPEWGVLNERWTYAMSATLPVLFVDVSVGAIVANATSAGVPVLVPGYPTWSVKAPNGALLFPASLGGSSSTSGLGDVVLFPLMFNQKINPDINLNYRVGIYTPTGSYEVGRLSNTGKNYWTVEPTVAFMYLGQKNGREASVFFGADFNTENTATHYQTGTQLHLDGTVAQHFPFAGGMAGVGLTAYWYQQVSGDSGSGASFGKFEARTNGIGPVLSFVGEASGHKAIAELRWMHEYEVQKRLSGDTLFLKAMLFF
jgi:hypothetical protein